MGRIQQGFDGIDGMVHVVDDHDGREPLGVRFAAALQYSAHDKGERYADGGSYDRDKELLPVHPFAVCLFFHAFNCNSLSHRVNNF